jgi:hydrogenase maturation factor
MLQDDKMPSWDGKARFFTRAWKPSNVERGYAFTSLVNTRNIVLKMQLTQMCGEKRKLGWVIVVVGRSHEPTSNEEMFKLQDKWEEPSSTKWQE